MGSPATTHVEVHDLDWNRRPRSLRIRFQAGVWHLSEDGATRIGGMFSSLASAVAYARSELRGVRGARVVLELDGAAYDGGA
jgi:hypothetical protein